jgi:hypothetical protein
MLRQRASWNSFKQPKMMRQHSGPDGSGQSRSFRDHASEVAQHHGGGILHTDGHHRSECNQPFFYVSHEKETVWKKWKIVKDVRKLHEIQRKRMQRIRRSVVYKNNPLAIADSWSSTPCVFLLC